MVKDPSPFTQSPSRTGTIAVVVNPAAGGGRALDFARRAVAGLRAAGRTVELHTGASREESLTLARAAVADGAAVLVACGGDGMIHCALQAVAGSQTALGILACGTGNDFARSLGLPVNDPARAVEMVVAGATRSIDLGRIAGTDGADAYVGTVLACGFDSRVADRAAGMRWPAGRSRYQLAMLAELAKFRPIDFKLTLDGHRIELPAMLVAVGNGPFYGGGMRVCPAADLGDGRLDVTVITAIPRRRLIRIFPQVYTGRHVQRPEVLTYRARSVTVEAAATTTYADGEFVSNLPVTCTSVPQAATVVVNAGRPA